MKNRYILIVLLFSLYGCNKTKIMEGKDHDPIIFTPNKIIFSSKIDTIEVKANKWIDITYGNNYPLGHEGIEDHAILANNTQDTLTSEWLKAVALREGENIMKVITLSKNDTGKERSYCVNVGVGPSFGSLVVTQLSE